MAEKKFPTLCLSFEKFCLALFHGKMCLWTKNIFIFPKTMRIAQTSKHQQAGIRGSIIRIELKVCPNKFRQTCSILGLKRMLLITRNQLSNLMLGLKVKYRSGHSQASSLNYKRRTKLPFQSDPNTQQGRPLKAGEASPPHSSPPISQAVLLSSRHLLGPAQSLPFLNVIFMRSLRTELKRS